MNKGFTLVELLAVIIILSLLIALTSTSVTKVVKSSKEDLSSSQIKLIESAAKNWGSENMSKLPENGNCKYLTLTDLSELGYISNDVIDPNTNKKIDENLKIKISSKIKNNKNIITYEVDSKEINNCPHVSPCILLKGEEDTIGSKYECEVKPGTKYNFYVTSHEEDGTTNLIMDRNISENDENYLYWNEDGYTTYGPESVMQFLYNATKTWKNITPINYTYKDREYQGIALDNADTGYTSFVSINGVATITQLSGDTIKIGTESIPLRARMPIYSGVWNDDWDGKITEKGDVSNKKEDGSNAFLYDNLDSLTKCYWTMSSIEERSYAAWFVDYEREVDYSDGEGLGYGCGVRPIINVEL